MRYDQQRLQVAIDGATTGAANLRHYLQAGRPRLRETPLDSMARARRPSPKDCYAPLAVERARPVNGRALVRMLASSLCACLAIATSAAAQDVSLKLQQLQDALKLNAQQERAWSEYKTAIVPSDLAQTRHRAAQQLLPELKASSTLRVDWGFQLKSHSPSEGPSEAIPMTLSLPAWLPNSRRRQGQGWPQAIAK